MNIECGQETLEELEHAFKFNDAVLRHLTIKTKSAVSVPSAMMREEKSRSMTGDAPQTPPSAPAEVEVA